jgi:putative membrane protein
MGLAQWAGPRGGMICIKASLARRPMLCASSDRRVEAQMMKRVLLAGGAVALSLAALPAFAQQAAGNGGGPGPMYGYGHMWGWGGGMGWHIGIMFFPFLLLLALIGVVALILWLVRWSSPAGRHHHGCPHCWHRWQQQGRGALDILEERFARGEIGKEEFEDKRRLLGR